MIGVAREISVITGNSLKIPQSEVRESAADIRDLTSVTIEAPDLCPRYAARLIQGVKVAPSPARGYSAGLKPLAWGQLTTS